MIYFRSSLLFAAVVASIATSSDDFDHSIAIAETDGTFSLESNYESMWVTLEVSVPTDDVPDVQAADIRMEAFVLTWDQDEALVEAELWRDLGAFDTLIDLIDPTEVKVMTLESSGALENCEVRGNRCYTDWDVALYRLDGGAEVEMAWTTKVTVEGPLNLPIDVRIEPK